MNAGGLLYADCMGVKAKVEKHVNGGVGMC